MTVNILLPNFFGVSLRSAVRKRDASRKVILEVLASSTPVVRGCVLWVIMRAFEVTFAFMPFDLAIKWHVGKFGHDWDVGWQLR